MDLDLLALELGRIGGQIRLEVGPTDAVVLDELADRGAAEIDLVGIGEAK